MPFIQLVESDSVLWIAAVPAVVHIDVIVQYLYEKTIMFLWILFFKYESYKQLAARDFVRVE